MSPSSLKWNYTPFEKIGFHPKTDTRISFGFDIMGLFG